MLKTFEIGPLYQYQEDVQLQQACSILNPAWTGHHLELNQILIIDAPQEWKGA